MFIVKDYSRFFKILQNSKGILNHFHGILLILSSGVKNTSQKKSDASKDCKNFFFKANAEDNCQNGETKGCNYSA